MKRLFVIGDSTVCLFNDSTYFYPRYGYGTQLEKYLNKLLKDSRFKDYSMSIKNLIREKAHVLPEKEEIMLSKAMKSLGGFSDVYDNIDTLDLKFESVKDSKGKSFEVNQHNYSELMESKDRTLRKNAYLSYLKGYQTNNAIYSPYQ